MWSNIPGNLSGSQFLFLPGDLPPEPSALLWSGLFVFWACYTAIILGLLFTSFTGPLVSWTPRAGLLQGCDGVHSPEAS